MAWKQTVLVLAQASFEGKLSMLACLYGHTLHWAVLVQMLGKRSFCWMPYRFAALPWAF